MSKIHGQATLRINGQVYESEDDATLKPGGFNNTPRMIGQKFHYSQTTLAASVVCKIPVTAETSLRELQEMNEAEVTFESDTGKTFIVRNAAQTRDLELTGGDSGGTVELEFMGEPAEEMI